MTKVYDLAPPRNWQDFEDLCLDLFRDLYAAQTALKHGRQGQKQAGVDVYGLLPDGTTWFGVQCKKKLGTEVTEDELRDEAEKARGFNPALGRFVLATTTQCDAAIQKAARQLTTESPFEVLVYDWDHFCIDLANRPELMARHFGTQTVVTVENPTSPAEALHTFRREHWSGLLPLPSLAQARGQRHQDLLLTDVYTALDVSAIVRVRGDRLDDDPRSLDDMTDTITLPGDRAYLGRLVRHERSLLIDPRDPNEEQQRRCRALEAAAANRHVVLVGKPGSGKSTFGRFLVACLLGETLGRVESNLALLEGDRSDGFAVWPHGAPLAIFVSLQKFQKSACFPEPNETGEAKHLTAYLESLGPASGHFGSALRETLRQSDGALLVLDGLDETPSAENSRVQLKGVISAFARAYPGCRVLVTSRPYAYEAKSPWRLDDAGFASVELAAFDAGQQRAFIEAWYRRLVARKLLDVTEKRRRAMVDDLTRQVQSTDYLAPLATSPLMLTMMADLHASNSGRLPTGGRAALYAESVALLLDRWNESRDGDKPSEDLGMSLDAIQEALQALAFAVHRSRGVSEDGTPEIQRAELWEALVDARGTNAGAVDDRRIMDYLHQRSGILLGESETIYRFPHRSYQEYLAAAHLVETDFPDLLGEVVTEDPELWREVVALAVGQVKPFMAWTILETLVPSSPPDNDPALDDPRFLRALFAGLAIREQQLAQKLTAANADKCERVRLWLRRTVERGALDVQDRADAGHVLGHLGDDRVGVGLGRDGLPDFEWVEIPAGSFVVGSRLYSDEKPVHDEHVDAFRISRYPLTNTQYEAFVDDGGYTDRWRHCWTDAGWEWKADREEPHRQNHPFDVPNYPRVSVCWYEAVAFCRWLSEKTGRFCRLPTEAEWERAGRGVDGREYPWGAQFDASLGNSSETGIGTTTAVGIFRGGEGPVGENGMGLLDATTNVAEWCSAQWRRTYDEPPVDDLEGSTDRVLRGGSFAGGDVLARCACRYAASPGRVAWYIGFRVVSPSSG